MMRGNNWKWYTVKWGGVKNLTKKKDFLLKSEIEKEKL
jgi:hypothetical protein